MLHNRAVNSHGIQSLRCAPLREFIGLVLLNVFLFALLVSFAENASAELANSGDIAESYLSPAKGVGKGTTTKLSADFVFVLVDVLASAKPVRTVHFVPSPGFDLLYDEPNSVAHSSRGPPHVQALIRTA